MDIFNCVMMNEKIEKRIEKKKRKER